VIDTIIKLVKIGFYSAILFVVFSLSLAAVLALLVP